MTKIKSGEADPTMPGDHKIETHSKAVSANSSSTVSFDYNYDSEPIIAMSTDVTPVNWTSKGTSQVTLENDGDSEAQIEIIVIGK